ncbi:BMC domain-containing protein [Klebsiella sp. I138]|uniref:BMC domain-containing protein n=1 Tax=Klebsiella sp. I138 TaxID=2755385 RepID=UPI003DA8AC01
MSGQSLGLIETVGLTVAVEAADAAIKSANVELVGYELTKGGGLVTVKLTGEVGAMNAAVSAGVAAAGRIGQVYAWKVIARTASGIEHLIASPQTCGAAPEPALSAADIIPAATSHPDSAIPVVNLESVTEPASCFDIEDALSVASSQPPVEKAEPAEVQPAHEETEQNAEPVQALADEKKTARTRAKSTRR